MGTDNEQQNFRFSWWCVLYYKYVYCSSLHSCFKNKLDSIQLPINKAIFDSLKKIIIFFVFFLLILFWILTRIFAASPSTIYIERERNKIMITALIIIIVVVVVVVVLSCVVVVLVVVLCFYFVYVYLWLMQRAGKICVAKIWRETQQQRQQQHKTHYRLRIFILAIPYKCTLLCAINTQKTRERERTNKKKTIDRLSQVSNLLSISMKFLTYRHDVFRLLIYLSMSENLF